jgi:hypothetical protein
MNAFLGLIYSNILLFGIQTCYCRSNSCFSETEQEKQERKRRTSLYNRWARNEYPHPIPSSNCIDEMLDSITPTDNAKPAKKLNPSSDINFFFDVEVNSTNGMPNLPIFKLK